MASFETALGSLKDIPSALIKFLSGYSSQSLKAWLGRKGGWPVFRPIPYAAEPQKLLYRGQINRYTLLYAPKALFHESNG